MAKETEKKKQTGKTAPKSASSKSTSPKSPSPKKKTPSTPKETSPKKAAPAKKATPKKSAPQKQTPTEPEKKPLFRKKTIAERTVAFKTRNWAALFRWIGILLFSLLAVFFHFFMLGYSFTVTVCCGIVALLLFYNLLPVFGRKYPIVARRLKRMVSVILCIGILLACVTEFFILKASFGEPKESCDYAVLLGAKVRTSGPSVSLMDRIYGARDYMEAHPEVTVIVSGGQGPDEPMTEAQCMYEELVKLGIDPERIWLEDKATSTWENLNFSLNLIEEKTGLRPEKIGIISSEYHLFRASLFANSVGVESVGIPARTSILSQLINHLMREVVGVWHYLILGGQYHA